MVDRLSEFSAALAAAAPPPSRPAKTARSPARLTPMPLVSRVKALAAAIAMVAQSLSDHHEAYLASVLHLDESGGGAGAEPLTSAQCDTLDSETQVPREEKRQRGPLL